MKSHAEIIDRWPSLDELAADVGESLFVVRKWFARGRIASSSWHDVAEAAKRRNIPVDLELLARLARKKKRSRVRAPAQARTQ